METITVDCGAKEYLDSVHGKSIIVSTGGMVKQVPDTGRYGFIICGNDGRETYSEYEYINCTSYFCCILYGFLKALDRLDEGSEAVFVTSKQREFDKGVPDERRLFDELCRKANDKHIKADWLSIDKDNELNKNFISSYIEEKVPGFWDNIKDYWGCPIQLFEYEILENDDIEKRLDEKSGDILIVSVPVHAGSKRYKALSMMRLIIDGTARLLIYEGNKIFGNVNETALNGMLALTKRLTPARDEPKFTVYIAAQYKMGFSSDSNRHRELCDRLYTELKNRGYTAVEIRMSDTNEDLKKRQAAARKDTRSKSDIIRDYIIKHRNNAVRVENQIDDPCISTYIIENYR